MISVIIPTCNRNDLLAKCLDCLAPGKQSLSFSEYEVIVTDDGNDTTAEQMLKEKYPWARWTQGPRKGPAANRNHGASQAKGEWLAFTDDDCLPNNGWLKAMLGAAKSGENVVEGRTISKDLPDSPYFEAPVNERGGLLWSCNFAIKKLVFEELEGFDERFPQAACEDVDFRLRIEQSGQKVIFAPQAVVDHPPRKLRPLSTRRRMHISEVLLAMKHNNVEGLSGRLFDSILKAGLREIKKHPLRPASYRYAFDCWREARALKSDFASFVSQCEKILQSKPA